MEDSDTMVEEMLHKLGFMDTSLKSDLNEAIQVFSSVAINKRNWRQVARTSVDLESYSFSLSMLRCVLLRNEAGGEWQLPLSDFQIRRYLIAQDLLPGSGATKDDVLHVFRKHWRRIELPNCKT